MADITQVTLLDLVPPSIRSDPQVQAAAAAIDKELQAVTAAIPTVVLYARIDELPEDVLDVLAWQLHVDFYEPIGFSIDKKRAMIKQSIAWHRHKGTPWAVEQVVSAAFARAEVREWFNYGGKPFRFKVRTIDSLPDDEAYQRLIRAIFTAKNTRSWLDEETSGIEVQREIRMPVLYGSAARFGSIQTIAPRIVIPAISVATQYGQVLRKAARQVVGLRLPAPAISQYAGSAVRLARITKIHVREA